MQFINIKRKFNIPQRKELISPALSHIADSITEELFKLTILVKIHLEQFRLFTDMLLEKKEVFWLVNAMSSSPISFSFPLELHAENVERRRLFLETKNEMNGS